MPITSYHAKYFAYELTRQYSSDSLQKLAASLSDAQVDLNPHQVHQNEVIICSYHFARAKDAYIKLINDPASKFPDGTLRPCEYY